MQNQTLSIYVEMALKEATEARNAAPTVDARRMLTYPILAIQALVKEIEGQEIIIDLFLKNVIK